MIQHYVQLGSRSYPAKFGMEYLEHAIAVVESSIAQLQGEQGEHKRPRYNCS